MFKYYGKTAPYLFLLPAGIVLLIFFFIPFFQTIGLSFFDYANNIYSPNFAGLKNYIEILHNPIFYKVMINTIIYLVVAVPILAIVPLFLAILINQKIRGITLYKILIYLPVIVSIVVAAIAFKWLYAEQGILNYLLNVLHIHSIGWLTDPKYAIYSVIIVTIWKGIGYYMMIYLAALMSVPNELYEAAEIDGATAIQRFRYITLPMLMPSVTIVLFLLLANCFKLLDQNVALTEGAFSTRMLAMQIMNTPKDALPPDYGYAQAEAVVFFVLVAAVTMIQVAVTKSKEVEA